MAPPQIRCVHCYIRLATRMPKYRLSAESDQLFALIQRSVHPRDVTREDVICWACRELLSANHTEAQGTGHRKVCPTCSRSLLQSRKHKLHKADMSQRDILIMNVVSEWIALQQISPCDEICSPCWLRARRVAIAREHISNDAQAVVGEQEAGPQENSAPEADPQENDLHERSPQEGGAQDNGSREDYAPEDAAQEDDAQDSAQEDNLQEDRVNNNKRRKIKESDITLRNLRRAANSSSRCLFLECHGKEKYHVPNVIRKMVLKDFKFYIPPSARICQLHMTGDYFRELYAAENAMSTFTAAHIEEMVILSSEDHSIDLGHPENLDDHLFQYLFGRTKHEYQQILLQVPRLSCPKLKCGLNAILCKMRTGDSDEKIAALFQIPRTSLRTYVKQTTDIILQETGGLEMQLFTPP